MGAKKDKDAKGLYKFYFILILNLKLQASILLCEKNLVKVLKLFFSKILDKQIQLETLFLKCENDFLEM